MRVSRQPWPPRLAIAEGLATARTGRWTSLLVVVVVAWLCAAPGAADAVVVSDLVRQEQAWVQAGAFVYRVEGSAPDGVRNPVPVGACERLAQADGVQGAFSARRDQANARLARVPGGQVSLVHVSPGAVGFFGSTDDPRGVALLTAGLAERTGSVEGEPVRVLRSAGPGAAPTSSDLLRVRVVPTTQLGEDYDGVLMVPTALEQTADACFVRTDPAHAAAVEELLPSALAWDGLPAKAASRLFEGEFTVDFTTAYQDRTLRWGWLACGLLGGLVWALVQWFRRSQTAIYATFGMRAAPRLLMSAAEWVVLGVWGGIWGWSLGVAGALALGAASAQAVRQVTWHTALTLVVATAVAVVVGVRPTGTLLHQLKDR